MAIKNCINFQKIVTIIQCEVYVENGEIKERNGRVWNTPTKAAFYEWASTQDAMNIRVNNGRSRNNLIKHMEEMGFYIEVNEDYGFEWECQIYASR